MLSSPHKDKTKELLVEGPGSMEPVSQTWDSPTSQRLQNICCSKGLPGRLAEWFILIGIENSASTSIPVQRYYKLNCNYVQSLSSSDKGKWVWCWLLPGSCCQESRYGGNREHTEIKNRKWVNSVPLLGNDEIKCVSTLRCNHAKLSLSGLLRHRISHQDKLLL